MIGEPQPDSGNTDIYEIIARTTSLELAQHITLVLNTIITNPDNVAIFLNNLEISQKELIAKDAIPVDVLQEIMIKLAAEAGLKKNVASLRIVRMFGWFSINSLDADLVAIIENANNWNMFEKNFRVYLRKNQHPEAEREISSISDTMLLRLQEAIEKYRIINKNIKK
jgi:hypothetical protein